MSSIPIKSLVVKRLANDETLPTKDFLCHVNNLVLQLDTDGRIVSYANPQACGQFGRSLSEMQAAVPWWDHMLDQESAVRFQNFFVSQVKTNDASNSPVPTGAGSELLLTGISSVGSTFPLRVDSVFVAAKQVLLLLDTVEGDSAAEMLRQSQARFRSVVDSLSVRLILKDKNGRRIYANQAYLEHKKLNLEDVLGKSDHELFPKKIADQYSADDAVVLQTGQVIHKFEENVDADGNATWTEMIKGPLHDADENIVGVQLLFWDATERVQTEKAFEREKYLLHALLDNVPDSIYFKDRDSRFMRVSRGMAKKFEISNPETVIGKTDADIFTAEHAGAARRDELRIMQTGQPIVGIVERETWADHPDTWCSSTKLPLYDSDGNIVGTFGISRDITDMIVTENKLRDARDQADRANRAKSEFLANMSHEIRTPMNGIIGMVELLNHTHLQESQRSFLDMIDQSAQSLLRIINDILDFSKIEAGKLDLENRPFEIKRCVSHAAKSLAARAAQKSLDLRLEMDDDIPETVVGDPDRLRQILVNLVGNAIKFTHEGEIRITAKVASGPPAEPRFTLHFAVSDSGIGIPADKQAAIFEAFAQADLSTTRQYGGTGLGLSISSQLVEMMQGRIWLESEPDVGSTFHFTADFECDDKSRTQPSDESELSTPLKGLRVLILDDNKTSCEHLRSSLERRGVIVTAAEGLSDASIAYEELASQPEQPVALVIDSEVGGGQGMDWLRQLRNLIPTFNPIVILLRSLIRDAGDADDGITSTLQKPALPSEICHALRKALASSEQPQNVASLERPNAQPADTGLHVLLAEDGDVNRVVLVGLLGLEGHRVTEVKDGQQAVEAWRRETFDAIFMDLQMPVMDGIEATRMIRAEETVDSHIPIIAITAAAMDDDHQRCLQAGMDDYLSKPVNVQELKRVLDGLLNKHNRDGSADHNEQDHLIAIQSRQPTMLKAPASQTSINFQAPLSKLRYTSEQLKGLVMTLRIEVDQRLNELIQAIDTSDAKLLIRASHSLRSAAAMFEVRELVAIAEKVEVLSRKGDVAGAGQYFSELREIATATISDVDTWLEAQ